MAKPTLGETVVYVNEKGESRDLTITNVVDANTIDGVFPSGTATATRFSGIKHSAVVAKNTWHFPSEESGSIPVSGALTAPASGAPAAPPAPPAPPSAKK